MYYGVRLSCPSRISFTTAITHRRPLNILRTGRSAVAHLFDAGPADSKSCQTTLRLGEPFVRRRLVLHVDGEQVEEAAWLRHRPIIGLPNF